MQTESAYDTDVLVIGAGPVGLTAAAHLQRFGIRHRIIDRREAASRKSKAAGVWSRTLETLESLGLAETFSQHGVHATAMNLFSEGKRLAHVDMAPIESHYNYLLILPQDRTEGLLAEHYEQKGGVIERGVELMSFEQDKAGVSATLSHGGEESPLRCRYLIACDGIGSTVRRLLRLDYDGEALAEDWMVGDLEIDGPLPENEVCGFFDEDGPMVFFPMGGGRYRIIAGISERKNDKPTVEDFQDVCEARTQLEMTLAHPRDLDYFKIQERLVPQYRRQRVFLAGDAAHVHSPAGGQGMNTGMQDAHNLAWKLAFAVQGLVADEQLLDSYHDERYPVASSVIKATGLSTHLLTLKSRFAQSLRNKVVSTLANLPLVQARGLAASSETSIHYRNGPLAWEEKKGLSHAWLFKGGAAPGDHAPDVEIKGAFHGKVTRLAALFRAPKFQLLLFSGISNEVPRGLLLFRLASQAAAPFAELVDVHVIIHGESYRGTPSEGHSLWLDPYENAHHAYAAAEETFYLIRPDGYVAMRSQPAHLEDLAVYFKRIGLQHRAPLLGAPS